MANDVAVRLDERIRLMSAVLAATTWPDQSQERKPHGTHAHARGTRKFLNEHRGHPAVQGLQNLLDGGAPLEAMFTFVMHLSWPSLEIAELPRWVPPEWNIQLRDFYLKSNLEQWWKDEDIAWQKSLTEATRMFEKVEFKPFLNPFLGDITESFIYVPNISYPTDQEIGIRVGSDLLVIAPPRLAWGDSPPWPFDEDPSHVYRGTLSQISRLLLMTFLRANNDKLMEITDTTLPVSDQFKMVNPTWQEQFTSLFVAAACGMFLETAVSKAEAKAYILDETRVRGMTILPGMISVLQRYLKEYDSGRYTGLLDFLPVFPKQLRVANRIVTL